MRRLLLVAGIVGFAACGSSAPPKPEVPPVPQVDTPPSTPPEAPPPGAPVPTPPDAAVPPADGAFEGTAGVVDVQHEGTPARLVEVRTGRHEGYDRVVFEFADRVPGHHLEYVDRPLRACGSGEAVPVAGDAWLQVRLTPAQAHDDAGQATAGERSRKPGGLAVVRQLERTCDFEGDVTWVLGVAHPGRYRVQDLASPPRLVVDVRAP